MTVDSTYMTRCIELAKLGAGAVAPNPMVGAVLVHGDRIIGEGYHQKYGEAHAEVVCIASVKEKDKPLIAESTLYVSLEPCAHFGKTPPCADLIIRNKIPKVIIGCRDPFKEVDGKGIEKLKAAGIEVETGVLEAECKELNKRFLTFQTEHRPYIILKWAQTGDGKIAAPLNLPPTGGETSEDSKSPRLHISNEYSNRLVHKWRSEEASILVGTNTALVDDPELTTRLWPGNSPVRLVVDMNLRLPPSLKLFNGKVKTIIFNSIKQEEKENLFYYKLEKNRGLVAQLMSALFQLQIQSVIVEGGAMLLQTFIDEGIWDEMRIITNTGMVTGTGFNAPRPENAILVDEQPVFSDTIEIYQHINPDPVYGR